MSRKPRVDADGPSALQQLKALGPEEHEFILSQGKELSSARLIAQIASRHGIHGLTEQRLSDFWRWHAEQEALREMNEAAVTFRQNFSKDNPSATLEEAHEATLAFLHLKAGGTDDVKLMKFVLGEIRKARALAHEREKFREDLKTKLEKGLDALFQEIKGNASALQHFEAIRESLAK